MECNERQMEQVLRQYAPLVCWVTNGFYPPAGESREDLELVGKLGLYYAVRDYNPELGECSFESFAVMAIRRQVISFIKTANRKKHGPLNGSVGLRPIVSDDHYYRNAFDTDGFDITESAVSFADRSPSALDQIVFEETTQILLESLSELERKVVEARLAGKSYATIAHELFPDMARELAHKRIDNCLCRARRKLSRNEVHE